MLQIPKNYVVETLPTGCCGMAGAFGYERDHYEISMKIGEEVLFPSIRDDVKVEERAKLESKVLKLVAAPGTSCRQQILDGTGIKAMHPVEILFDALR
jgi:Fe-S oxidoreductase